MHLARHSISSTTPINVIDARFDADCSLFAATTPQGFGIYKTCPLKLLRKRDLTGTLSKILPLHATNILFLVGGGRNPRYPPNKVVFWDESIGKEIVELEFREQVRGIACRRGTLAVALKRRVVVFGIDGEGKVERKGEWETSENERGLLALATAPGSTLLVIPGRKVGHVQLIHLSPCPSKPLPSPPPNRPPPQPQKKPQSSSKDPIPIIIAHTTSLTTLALPPSGRFISTTSLRGTLIRIWDAVTGKLVNELRRGSDHAVIYGVAFRPDENEVCVWSDKGTVHLFKLNESGEGSSNRQSTFSPLKTYLPKYFSSQWSYAQYRLPSSSKHIALNAASGLPPDPDAAEEERCVVGWIQTSTADASPAPSSSQRPKPRPEFQLIALTYSGGWYRLGLPSASPYSGGASASSSSSLSLDTGSTVGGGGRRLSGSNLPPRSPPSAVSSRPANLKGKESAHKRERSSNDRPLLQCELLEFKRFGRWDGWM